MAKQRRIWSLVVGIVGLVLVAGSFVWTAVAVPALVKYPDDVDETPVYEGEVVLYVDPATAAPLPEPKTFPLTVERNIKSVASSSELVVVKETAVLKAEGLFEGTQEQQYVMDREDMVNVADDRAWAFAPANVVDRAGAFRINLPFDNSSKPYTIFSNETETTYEAVPDPAAPTGKVEGLSVNNFVADFEFRPASAAYLASLDASLPAPLPRELGLDKLAPLLASKGIDLQQLLPVLLPALSEADRATVGALAQQPVKLVYLFRASGAESTDQSTGAIVAVAELQQFIAAAPDPALVPQLEALLSKYTQVSGVTEALDNLEKLAAEPIPLFTNTFSQTAASIADIADSVQENADRKNLAENTIPRLLLISGIVLAVLGFAIFAFWLKGPKAAPEIAASPPVAPAAVPPPPVVAVDAVDPVDPVDPVARGSMDAPPPAVEAAPDPPPGGTTP